MKSLLFLLLFFYAGLSYAENVHVFLTRVDTNLVRCLKASESEASTRMCYYRSYELTNNFLKAVILQVRIKLSKEEAEYKKTGSQLNMFEAMHSSLVLSQEGWEKYLEGHCELLSTESYGGPNATNIRNECLYRMTKQRLIEVARNFNY